MNARHRLLVTVLLLATVTGCATTQISNREILVDEKVPRPKHIFVYDFVSRPEDAQADSALAGQKPATPPSKEQIALGLEIGTEVAKELVAQIEAMGLPAEHGTPESAIGVGDLMIRGTLLSVEEGSSTKRVAIGMGFGDAVLHAAIEAYAMTPQGARKLGSGSVGTTESKNGVAVPLVMAAATKNPLGLIVTTGMRAYDEKTGSSTIQGKAKDVATAIATEIRPRFEKQGWIAPLPSE